MFGVKSMNVLRILMLSLSFYASLNGLFKKFSICESHNLYLSDLRTPLNCQIFQFSLALWFNNFKNTFKNKYQCLGEG